MRIITILLLLLLASPSVFAETWVYSYQSSSDVVQILNFERSDDVILERVGSSVQYVPNTIAYEDETTLVFRMYTVEALKLTLKFL